MNRYISGTAVSALALVLAGPALADIGTPAGVAGAVSGSVGLTSPAKQIVTPVAVRSGDGIVMGDNLATGADSRLQVMLLDESAITLGPDAELTIDEFVFDPANTNQDLLAATLLKGAFRLVTGGVARQNPDGTTLNLPNAVLTIRGTTVIGACATSCVVALAGSGEANSAGKKPSTATIRTPKGEATLKRAGFYVEIDADGNISPPARLTEAVEERFATLFPRIDAPGALQRAAFVPQGRGLLEQSGQPAQEGRPLAVNQHEFERADQLDGNDLFEMTTNLPLHRLRYQSGAIGFSGGSGDGDYFVTYNLDLASRSFSGSVFVDHQDNGFQTTIPLLHDPFQQGLSLNEKGFVLDPTLPNDVFDFSYTIGTGGIETTFNYDEDGPGTAPPSTGSGTVPVVP
ncbi:FecR family protein [Dongia mobilis]|uniref:FecR family protein n=1 Tax=Dongia mobilis TaxID=578943 RepID=A0A4R6WVH9_9PROT|nr:FecR domain-containing protein [Dongia mobilis]TDQ84024.1 FecR family protein [Dongia mobilis]